jgi:hypothetical protein
VERLHGARSGTYVVIQHASGEVIKGISDMSIFDQVSPQHVRAPNVSVALALLWCAALRVPYYADRPAQLNPVMTVRHECQRCQILSAQPRARCASPCCRLRNCRHAFRLRKQRANPMLSICAWQLLSHASDVRSAAVVVADMNLNVRVLRELANVLRSTSSFGAPHHAPHCTLHANHGDQRCNLLAHEPAAGCATRPRGCVRFGWQCGSSRPPWPSARAR